MSKYKLVPIEPTQEMIDEGRTASTHPRERYKAMLAAAPQPEPDDRWLVAIAAVLYAVNYCLSADLRSVQSAEVTLVCVMKDESRTIAPNQVTGLMDGVWLFENGHARNCEVVKGGDL